MASIFIFLCDFATKILYLRISKFASIQIRELYVKFIELRLLLILIYTVFVVASNTMKMLIEDQTISEETTLSGFDWALDKDQAMRDDFE